MTTGICLLCGFIATDLDALDEHHTARHGSTSPVDLQRVLVDRYGECPRCKAPPGAPCRSWAGHVVDPHVERGPVAP